MTDKTTNENENSKTGQSLTSETVPVDVEDTVLEKASGEAGTDQSQETADDEIEKGYRGESPDPNPADHYTLKSVLKRAKEQK
jgi:hypothetical protein